MLCLKINLQRRSIRRDGMRETRPTEPTGQTGSTSGGISGISADQYTQKNWEGCKTCKNPEERRPVVFYSRRRAFHGMELAVIVLAFYLCGCQSTGVCGMSTMIESTVHKHVLWMFLVSSWCSSYCCSSRGCCCFDRRTTLLHLLKYTRGTRGNAGIVAKCILTTVKRDTAA